MDAPNFQRRGSESNTHAGNTFEHAALKFFGSAGISLAPKFVVPVGVGDLKKSHKFDLGSENPPILVECKSHTWTKGSNVPSAKIAVWNEAMYYFHIAPTGYRKVLFVQKDIRRNVSLASWYLKNKAHLVPSDVELWEFDTTTNFGERVR